MYLQALDNKAVAWDLVWVAMTSMGQALAFLAQEWALVWAQALASTQASTQA